MHILIDGHLKHLLEKAEEAPAGDRWNILEDIGLEVLIEYEQQKKSKSEAA